MRHTKETQILKDGIISRFKSNTLTKEDKKHCSIKVNNGYHGKNPWGGKCFYIGREYLYFGGEAKCNLDTESKRLAKSNKEKTKYKVLTLNLDSIIAQELGLNRKGFYHYNSDRLSPDSIISIKQIN